MRVVLDPLFVAWRKPLITEKSHFRKFFLFFYLNFLHTLAKEIFFSFQPNSSSLSLDWLRRIMRWLCPPFNFPLGTATPTFHAMQTAPGKIVLTYSRVCTVQKVHDFAKQDLEVTFFFQTIFST